MVILMVNLIIIVKRQIKYKQYEIIDLNHEILIVIT
jgi:hypothetical protein